MDLSNLKPAKGSIKKRHRVGRGQGSGWGETSGRGSKGAASRSGYSKKKGFEGGQMPLQRRTPKRGFKNFNTIEYVVMNLDQIQQMVEKYDIKVIDQEILLANRIISGGAKLKVLGRGEIKTKIDISAHSFSKTAKSAIESKGGTANVIA